MCFNHAHDIILYSITDLNVMELIQAIKYVAVVFTICLHDMSEKKVMSFSTVIKQITEVLRLCMFKKEHCFGDKLDLQ